MNNSSLYDQDFYAWANEQAGLLRAGKLSEADIAHIAEEIESMGKTEKRELVSRLTSLLLHLLKWQVQPNRRRTPWKTSIANTRDDLVDHLADNPSLRAPLDATIAAAYRRAHREAAAETGLDKSIFSSACPWSFEQMMDENFWPGGQGRPVSS